jgi:hypothetical protein
MHFMCWIGFGPAGTVEHAFTVHVNSGGMLYYSVNSVAWLKELSVQEIAAFYFHVFHT